MKRCRRRDAEGRGDAWQRQRHVWRGHTLGSVNSDRGSYAGTDRGQNSSKPASLCQTVTSRQVKDRIVTIQSSMEPDPNPG